MGKVTDEHEVVVLVGDASDPGRRVVVRRERVGLLGINVEQSAPDLGCLASPRLARMEYPAWLHTEPFDCPTSDASDGVSTVCCERPFRVFILGLGLSVLDEIELHFDEGTGRHAVRSTSR